MLKSIAVEEAVLCCSYQIVNEIIEKCTLKQPEPHQHHHAPAFSNRHLLLLSI
jgi:hypothetical protein